MKANGRHRISSDEVGEEIADVIVMMCQMAELFGGDFFIQARMNAKMQRLIERVNGK